MTSLGSLVINLIISVFLVMSMLTRVLMMPKT